jgi:hypothetical protein
MKKLNKVANILTICMALVLVVSPFLADAQWRPVDSGQTGLPSGGLGSSTSLTDFIGRVINIALALAGLIAVLFLIIGGFRYITAGGNEDAASSAKKIILNAVIGIIVIILSFVVVRVVTNTFTTTNY